MVVKVIWLGLPTSTGRGAASEIGFVSQVSLPGGSKGAGIGGFGGSWGIAGEG